MGEYRGPFVADDNEARALMSLVTGADLPAEPAGEGKTMGPGMRDIGDSWAAEQFRLVLEHLRWNWGEAYNIGVRGGLWYAERRDGRGTLEEDGPEPLRKAIFEDYEALPVPREPQPGEALP